MKMNCYNFGGLIEDFIVFAPNKKIAREKVKQALSEIKRHYVHIWLKGIKIPGYETGDDSKNK